MYNGEIFTRNHTAKNSLILKNSAGFLNLKVNNSKNVVTAWNNSQEKQKVLLHFIDSVADDIQCLDEIPFSEGLHIAICNKLSIEDEIILIKLGIRSAIPESSPSHIILETISNTLNGNLYFSNEALSRFILKHKNTTEPKDQTLLMTSTTKKEKEVLSLVCNGLSNEQTADKLNVSINTIKMHMQNIYKKTNIRNRCQLFLAYNQGINKTYLK